jgi:menaquinone-dependent protoporphyrinogen IX oxidase
MKKTLIIVYSNSGKTFAYAQIMADKMQADIERIHPKHNPKSFLKFFYFGFKARSQKTVELLPLTKRLSEYDHFIVISPIHAGRISSPIFTFLKENASVLKQVDIILVKQDPKDRYESALVDAKKLIDIEFNLLDSIVLDK